MAGEDEGGEPPDRFTCLQCPPWSHAHTGGSTRDLTTGTSAGMGRCGAGRHLGRRSGDNADILTQQQAARGRDLAGARSARRSSHNTNTCLYILHRTRTHANESKSARATRGEREKSKTNTRAHNTTRTQTSAKARGHRSTHFLAQYTHTRTSWRADADARATAAILALHPSSDELLPESAPHSRQPPPDLLTSAQAVASVRILFASVDE